MANLHTSLGELFTNIANAIRTKTGSTDAIIADEFPSKIQSISTGINLPEIADDVLGSPSDLASGKQLIDDNGNIVTGVVVDSKSSYTKFGAEPQERISNYDGTLSYIEFTVNPGEPTMIESKVTLVADINKFGNATINDVAAGVTFTSQNGLKLTGTRVEPTVENWTLTLEDGSTVTKAVHVE